MVVSQSLLEEQQAAGETQRVGPEGQQWSLRGLQNGPHEAIWENSSVV